MDANGNYANKAGSRIPAAGQSGRVLNNKEGMGQPGNKLPATKHGMEVANKAGFRSIAARSMLRIP